MYWCGPSSILGWNIVMPATPSTSRTLQITHSADPDDGYAWWAVATGRLGIGGSELRVEAMAIDEINRRCIEGRMDDVCAISSAAWPLMSHDYAILSAGSSVGRGYGPALAAVGSIPYGRLAASTVAIPGDLTTGALLLRLFFPGVRTRVMPFREIAPAILRGEVDAGVLIHEELMNYRDRGLERLACLGQIWTEQTGLPIPVGLNVVKRELGCELMQRIADLTLASMVEAEAHREEATRWAMQYSIQCRTGIGEEFLHMFANEDTLCLARDCRLALNELFVRAHVAGLIPRVPQLEIVEVSSALIESLP